MFEKIPYYDYIRRIEQYNVLEEHHDVFKNELSINSYHVGEHVIHGDVPLDVVYKSNPTKEAIYLTYVYYGGTGIPTYLRLNIDSRETIEIEVDDSFEDKFYDIVKNGYSYRVYFEITKEQLYKLCLANSLAVQISDYHDSVMKEFTANGIIAVLQTLYNRAIDNTTFCDAEKRCIAFFEEEISKENAKDEDEKQKENTKKTLGYLMLFGGLIVLLIGILACCAVPYSGFGILCIIGGALIAIFSLVPFQS